MTCTPSLYWGHDLTALDLKKDSHPIVYHAPRTYQNEKIPPLPTVEISGPDPTPLRAQGKSTVVNGIISKRLSDLLQPT